MRRSPVTRALGGALAVVSVLVASPARAGYRVVDDTGEETLVSAGRLKMNGRPGESRQPQEQAMVLDIAHGRMWVADTARRAYWEGTVDEFCTGIRQAMGAALGRMGSQVQEQMAELQEQMAELQKQMATLPKEEQAQLRRMQTMMEQMATSAPAAPGVPPAPRVRRVGVQRTGETATVAGVAARRFRVLADGRPYEDLWLSTDPALSRELALERAPDTIGRMFACLFEGTKTSGGGVEDTAEYRRLFANGWPLKVVSYHEDDGGTPEGRTTTVVRTVERRDLPESVFRPPAGYRRAPFSAVFGADAR
jgi:hypothetical protein